MNGILEHIRDEGNRIVQRDAVHPTVLAGGVAWAEVVRALKDQSAFVPAAFLPEKPRTYVAGYEVMLATPGRAGPTEVLFVDDTGEVHGQAELVETQVP